VKRATRSKLVLQQQAPRLRFRIAGAIRASPTAPPAAQAG
jgi:hypothetical protein